jgi:NADPH-dependent curcumin reductase CurA
VQGFIISDHADRAGEFLAEVGPRLEAGRLKYRETVADGVERAGGLFIGESTGKMIVPLAAD